MKEAPTIIKRMNKTTRRTNSLLLSLRSRPRHTTGLSVSDFLRAAALQGDGLVEMNDDSDVVSLTDEGARIASELSQS